MRKAICLFITLIVGTFCATSAHAYDWPLSNASGPYPITGTLGESRINKSGGLGLHLGVDIAVSAGTEVYAREACPTSRHFDNNEINEWLECGHFKYVHIEVDNAFTNKEPIVAGDIIGTTKISHVHLTESSGNVNPLRKRRSIPRLARGTILTADCVQHTSA